MYIHTGYNFLMGRQWQSLNIPDVLFLVDFYYILPTILHGATARNA